MYEVLIRSEFVKEDNGNCRFQSMMACIKQVSDVNVKRRVV